MPLTDSIQRTLTPAQGHYFLLGPRGTGKTRWLNQTYPNALLIDLLHPGQYREYSARPERLLDLIHNTDGSSTVIIDEVQRVPDLLNVIHSLIENNGNLTFVLTGSSARKLRRQGTNLLGGRAVQRTMHPFLASELGESFNLTSALTIGMLPIVLAAKDPSDTLKSYTGLYITEEVQTEAMVKNIGSFARFLEIIAYSHGSELNLSNIARETSVSRKAVEGYLEILYDLMLAFSIPIFKARAKRQLVSKDKFYYFDTGIFLTLRPHGPLDDPGFVGGAALEGLIAQQLRAWIAYTRAEHKLYYWRTRGGLEVDFIVYGPGTFCAIETKMTSRVRNADLVSLKEFGKDYPEAKRILLYMGEEHLMIEGIQCLPVDLFLRNLVPEHTIL